MDNNGVSEKWLEKNANINKNTVTSLCNDSDYVPRAATRTKIIQALRKIDPNVKSSEFW